MVLYIYTIQRRSDPPATWCAYFQAAERCQSHISAFGGEKENFAQRYSIVLEELRLEAVKQSIQSARSATMEDSNLDKDRDTEVAHTVLRLSDNSHLDSYDVSSENRHIVQSGFRNMSSSDSLTTGSAPPQPPPEAQIFGVFGEMQPSMELAASNFAFPQSMAGTSPASLVGDATGWGEFDSFVSADPSNI